MSGTAAWRLVAWREITQRMRSKAFVISSLVLMAFAVAGVVLSAVTQDDDRERVRVAIVDVAAGDDVPSAQAVREALPSIADALDRDLRITVVADRAAADDLVREDRADVALDGTTAVWNKRIDDVEQAMVQAAVQSALRGQRAAEVGLSATELANLFAPVQLETTTIEPRDAGEGVRTGTAGVGLVLLFLSIQIHGAAVLMGVVEEKSSRVVEVVLGHVRPRSLLQGKVVGIGIVGLSQVALVAGTALLSLVAVRSVDAPKVPADAIIWFVVWFVLGFALYATIFAGLGSLVSRQEDAQSVVTPATVPLLLSYFVGFAAVANPDSLLVRITSIVPLSAPMVMPVRLAAGDPPVWEVALSLALLVATLVLVVRIAALVYERNVLRTGTRATLRGAWKSLRADR